MFIRLNILNVIKTVFLNKHLFAFLDYVKNNNHPSMHIYRRTQRPIVLCAMFLMPETIYTTIAYILDPIIIKIVYLQLLILKSRYYFLQKYIDNFALSVEGTQCSY